MKLTTVTALLLPASSVLAQAKFDTAGFRTSGPGCNNAAVLYSEANEVATVSLPNNAVGTNGQASNCAVTLVVSYPVGTCSFGTAVGRASGRLNIARGVRATFDRQDYSVSPTIGAPPPSRNLTQATGKFTPVDGPTNQDYTLTDTLTYSFNVRDSNNARVTFTTQGSGLQLQPAGNTGGSTFTNNQFVFDIRSQKQSATCQCESFHSCRRG